eukprot:4831205-Pleurochrysis_carterae.AAC.1
MDSLDPRATMLPKSLYSTLLGRSLGGSTMSDRMRGRCSAFAHALACLQQIQPSCKGTPTLSVRQVGASTSTFLRVYEREG